MSGFAAVMDSSPIESAPAADNAPARPAAAASLEEFFAGVERQAYRIALYGLREQEAALDAVQDSMLKLVEKYRGRPAAEWPALFFTILNHRITDLQRWRKLREAGGRLVSFFARREDGEEEDLLERGLGLTEADRNRTPENSLHWRQAGEHIERALHRLSERQRQVFLLREWQGFDVRETARIIGCTEGTVKQHHFRAIQSLRADLAEHWKGGVQS
jgi:RNA polymerase sigma-70 factor (ECF subfamily)